MKAIFNWKRLLPVIGVLLFVYIVYNVGIGEIIRSLYGIKWLYIIGAVVLLIPVALLQTLKFSVILRKQNINLNFLYLLRLQLISVFYGSVTPGRVGSLVKILYLKEKTGFPYGKCSVSVFIERMLDMLTVFLFGLVGAFFLVNLFTKLYLEMALAFAAFLVFVWLFVSRKGTVMMVKLARKFLMNSTLKEKATESIYSFYENLIQPKKLIWPFAIGILTWLIIYTQGYLIARAIGIELSFAYFLFTLSIGTVVGLIPITISGLGTREATLIVLFGAFGIKAEKVVAMSVLWVLNSLLVTIPGSVMSLEEGKYFEK